MITFKKGKKGRVKWMDMKEKRKLSFWILHTFVFFHYCNEHVTYWLHLQENKTKHTHTHVRPLLSSSALLR